LRPAYRQESVPVSMTLGAAEIESLRWISAAREHEREAERDYRDSRGEAGPALIFLL
jgi:hypothetical protein